MTAARSTDADAPITRGHMHDQLVAELLAMPRDREAERRGSRPSFSLGSHIPAIWRSATVARHSDVWGLSLEDADGGIHHFRLSRGSAVHVLNCLLHYLVDPHLHFDKSSGKLSFDGLPIDGHMQLPSTSAASAESGE